jgi:hypothetical protein
MTINGVEVLLIRNSAAKIYKKRFTTKKKVKKIKFFVKNYKKSQNSTPFAAILDK